MDEMLLTEVAEEEGFDVTNQMDVTKYLKLRVSHIVLPFYLAHVYLGFRADQQGKRYLGPT